MWKKLGAVPLLLQAPQKCCRTKGPSTWFSVTVFMSHSPWRTPPFTSAFASWVYKAWLIFRATILNMGAITIPYVLPLSEPQHLQNPVPPLSHVLSICLVFCYLPWTSRISSNYSKTTRGCLSKIDGTHSFHGTWEHGKCQEFVATRRGVSCPLSAEVVSSPGSVPLATPLLGMDHVLGTPPHTHYQKPSW